MSVPFLVRDALRWTGGSRLGGDLDSVVSGVSIDSRTVEPGDLFVAIVGPNHDGHRFLADALARGAGSLLLQNDATEVGAAVPVIAVSDTTVALGALASGHRQEFRGPVVAITGSNGKTTTKEMCAAILSVAAPCHRTPGNLNNQYGVPLTLLGRQPGDRSLVIEMGMNHRGEIARLVEIAQPTVSVITNVGSAHIEYLESLEQIALEKGDIVALLPPSATAVLNSDDPLVAAQGKRTRARVVRFGEDGDVRAVRVEAIDSKGYHFDLETPEGRTSIEVAGLGRLTVQNALAAAAAALAAGAALDEIASGLSNYRPIHGRLERRELSGGIVLIDDSYNANPQSTEAALRLLAELKGKHRAVAILGDMGELGVTSQAAHRGVGSAAATLGIDFLIVLGDRAECVGQGAVEAGMSPERALVVADPDEACARACEILQARDTVLVKGSRSMKMERIVEAIASEKGH